MLTPSTFQYHPSVTGLQLDATIRQAQLANVPMKIQPGLLLWQTVLNQVYQDFATLLDDRIHWYMNTAQCRWFEGGVTPFTFPDLNISRFTGLAFNSAQSIYTNIKILCKNAQIPSLGPIVWNQVFTRIFSDIVIMLDPNVTNAANRGVTRVPPGVVVSEDYTQTAEIPATAILQIPYQLATLQGELQAYWNAYTINGLAGSMNNIIRTSGRTLGWREQSAMVWSLFLNLLTQQINQTIPNAIQKFLTGDKMFITVLGAIVFAAPVSQKIITRGLGMGGTLLITQGYASSTHGILPQQESIFQGMETIPGFVF